MKNENLTKEIEKKKKKKMGKRCESVPLQMKLEPPHLAAACRTNLTG